MNRDSQPANDSPTKLINVFEVPNEHVDAYQQLLKRVLIGEVDLDVLYAGSHFFLSLGPAGF